MKDNGFTLLELIYVILLIAILVGMGMRNSISNFYPSRTVYNQAKQLKSKFIFMQELAKNFRQEIVIKKENDYTLSATWLSDDNKENNRKLSFSSDIIITLPAEELHISPSGNLHYDESDEENNGIMLQHVKYQNIRNQIIFDGKIIKVKGVR